MTSGVPGCPEHITSWGTPRIHCTTSSLPLVQSMTWEPNPCPNPRFRLCQQPHPETSYEGEGKWVQDPPIHQFCFVLFLFNLVWLGLVWFNFIWFCLISFGLVWFDLIWFGLIWFDFVWFFVFVWKIIDLAYVVGLNEKEVRASMVKCLDFFLTPSLIWHFVFVEPPSG